MRFLAQQIISEASSPVAAIHQEAQPTASHAGYGYSGTSYRNYGSPLSGGAKWPGGLTGDGRGHMVDHRRTRQNARASMHNVPQTRAIVKRITDKVVDIGMKPEPTPETTILGITKEEGESWGENVATRFILWAQGKGSDYTGTNNFWQTQRLYQTFQQRDGDIFCRFHYVKDADALNPLKLQFIDPDQVRGNSFTSTYGYQFSSTNSSDGINRDDRRREISYNIAVQKENGEISFVTVPRVGARSKRTMMIHGYNPEYAGQGRGFSELAHGLQELESTLEFSSAQILKAINQSNITMVAESTTGNPTINPFEGTSTIPAGPPTMGQPPAAATAGTIDEQAAISAEYMPIPEAQNRTPGSTGVFNSPGGQKLVPFQNTAPSDSFGPFMDSFVGHLSASMNVPIEVLLMRFNSNYSASRGALLMFQRVAEILREEMNSDFNNPVYEAWLSGEIAAGRVRAPGWSNPILRAAWLSCRWIGAPMENIDPMRTAKSVETYLNLSLTNQERESRIHNGSSAKVNIQKNKGMFSQTPVGPWAQQAAASGG